MSNSEFKNKCDKCNKRVKSRSFYRLVDGKWLWLCPVCWDIVDQEDKLRNLNDFIVRTGAKCAICGLSGLDCHNYQG